MTPPNTPSEEELRKHFEANMLDGENIEPGQMVSASTAFDYLLETLESQRQHWIEEVIETGPKDKTRLNPLERKVSSRSRSRTDNFSWVENEINKQWRNHLRKWGGDELLR